MASFWQLSSASLQCLAVAPATRLCASHVQAKPLIEDVAAAINFEIERVQQPIEQMPAGPNLAPDPHRAKARP